MASRRMLSVDVVTTDVFRDLSPIAQALYIQLLVLSDDDGFCGKTRSVMRAICATRAALEELVLAGYIIEFTSGVTVDVYWPSSNAVRKDRYKATTYKDEKALLKVIGNTKYALIKKDHPLVADPVGVRQPSDNQLTTIWQPVDNQVTTKWQPNDNQVATSAQPHGDDERNQESREGNSDSNEAAKPIDRAVSDGRQPSDNQVTTICQPSDNHMATVCQPVDGEMTAQVRLGKDSIKKGTNNVVRSSSTEPPEKTFSELAEKYGRQAVASAMCEMTVHGKKVTPEEVVMYLEARATNRT